MKKLHQTYCHYNNLMTQNDLIRFFIFPCFFFLKQSTLTYLSISRVSYNVQLLDSIPKQIAPKANFYSCPVKFFMKQT